MRPAKVTDEELYEDLAEVFRRKGYDGASYSGIMKATGLVKASLYHRFPNGKEQMVNAILNRVDKEFVDYVLAPAFAQGNVQERAEQVSERLAEFYAGGKRWCLLDTLTLAESKETMSHARRSMEFWVQAFARIARDAGVPGAEANRRAQDAVAAIEGGLVAARVLQNRGPFLRTMAGLAKQLTRRTWRGSRVAR